MEKAQEFIILTTLIILILFVLSYLGKEQPFSIETSNVRQDFVSKNFDVSNLDLINNYYEKEKIETVDEFPAPYIRINTKGLPFFHNKNLCLYLDLKTEDNWNLSYNREFSSPIIRNQLSQLEPIEVNDFFFYTDKNLCNDFKSCADNERIQYVKLITDSQQEQQIYKSFSTKPQDKAPSFENSTKILGDTNFFFYLEDYSFLDLTFSGELDNQESFVAVVEIQSLETNQKVYNEIINEHRTLQINSNKLKNFESGWYRVDIKYAETRSPQLISRIKTNSYFSTDRQIHIGKETEVFSFSQFPNKILLYSSEEINNNTELLVNNRTYMLTPLITKNNPIEIELEAGYNKISSTLVPLNIIGSYFGPSKDSIKSPYSKIFISENMEKADIKTDLFISNFEQRGTTSTLCFGDTFYNIFNHSREHEFLLTNLDLSTDINIYTSLLEYGFKNSKLNDSFDFWYGNEKTDPYSAKILFSNVKIEQLPKDINPEKLQESPFEKFSQGKIIFKSSTEPSYLDNFRLYTIND